MCKVRVWFWNCWPNFNKNVKARKFKKNSNKFIFNTQCPSWRHKSLPSLRYVILDMKYKGPVIHDYKYFTQTCLLYLIQKQVVGLIAHLRNFLLQRLRNWNLSFWAHVLALLLVLILQWKIEQVTCQLHVLCYKYMHSWLRTQ